MSLERQENSPDNPWWGEHVHRYLAAIKIIGQNKKVLDIACGNGFGSEIISRQDNQVIGADISEETIKYCQSNYHNEKLSFLVVDGTNTGFPAETFDAVVSFETIEHTTAYMKMLAEFRRITKKEGVIIISTPNFIINSPGGKLVNPYHTQEFTFAELSGILKGVFNKVEIYGQKYNRYNQKLAAFRVAQMMETVFYLRGVRKLPLPLKNLVINFLIQKPMYPTPGDYIMVSGEEEIIKCKTFFAVCR